MNSRIREIDENIKKCDFFKGNVSFDESLKEYTTMKVGGRAELLIKPFDYDSCAAVLKLCKLNHVPYFILGGGSNLVINDNGIDGVVLATHNLGSIEKICENDTEVKLKCGSGTTIKQIIDYCIENNIEGLQYFSGLPGTIGGASFMNARCYEHNICEYIESVEYIDLEDENFSLKTYIMDKKDWDYKKSPFMTQKSLIISVNLANLNIIIDSADKDVFETKCQYYIDDRKNKGHFISPSAGSVFKNNRDFGKPSGKLVDEAGLKGIAVGGAQVAPWHGNFIINNNNATAADIKNLVELVQKKVYENTGFLLEPEIIFV